MRMIILVLLAMAGTALATEDIFKWTDAQGSTHFGNNPPAGVQAESVNLSLQPVTVTAGEKVFVWTDAEGNTHYGDHPPAKIKAEQIDTNAVPMSTIRSSGFRNGEQQLLRQLEQQNR